MKFKVGQIYEANCNWNVDPIYEYYLCKVIIIAVGEDFVEWKWLEGPEVGRGTDFTGVEYFLKDFQLSEVEEVKQIMEAYGGC